MRILLPRKVECLSTSKFVSTRSTHVPFGTTNIPPDKENPIKGTFSSSSTQSPKIPNTVRNFQFFHAEVEYKRTPTTGLQTSLTAKPWNKCSNNKLCPQMAEINRKKYAYIKHSLLMFTSILVIDKKEKIFLQLYCSKHWTFLRYFTDIGQIVCPKGLNFYLLIRERYFISLQLPNGKPMETFPLSVIWGRIL